MATPIVTLNVGGMLYTTTASTLQKYPDSMLGALVSGKHCTMLDAQGNIYIDRDGPIFRHILNFLRTSQLCLPSKFTEMDLLFAEADFYQVKPLIDILQRKTQDKPPDAYYYLEITEIRTGTAATMPTNNSRVKTILSGRKDVILSLPSSVIGADILEKLQCKDSLDHMEVELYGSSARLKVGEELRNRGWEQVACDLSSSSAFDARSLHNCLVIEHSYRDRWCLTCCQDEFVNGGEMKIECTRNNCLKSPKPHPCGCRK